MKGKQRIQNLSFKSGVVKPLNPSTGALWKRGEVDVKTGKVFWRYDERVDGFMTHVPPSVFEKRIQREKELQNSNKELIAKKRTAYAQKNKKKLQEYQKSYYRKNKEVIKARSKSFYQSVKNTEEFKEKRRVAVKRYSSRHTEKVKARFKKWRSENIEKHKSMYIDWVQKNGDKRKAINDNYYLQNKEKILKERKELRKANPEIFSERFKKYYKENSTRLKEYQRDKTKKAKLRSNLELNKFYNLHDVPEYLWHKKEFPLEKDFQAALEHVLVKKHGLQIERWAFLEELGIPDIYLPEIDLIIEVKLHSSMWTKDSVEEQSMRYSEISDTIIVSLDGMPEYWIETEAHNSAIFWFNPEQLFQFVDGLIDD